MIVKFDTLYADEQSMQKARYAEIREGFIQEFGSDDEIEYFSAPGRTEIGGNHTDHNHGHVLAAAVNLDIVAAARKRDGGKIYLKSAEYPNMDIIDITELTKKEEEVDRSASLLRGICARCKELGYRIGGFEAYTKTRVLKGSGLSSSAAFEVVLVTMLSHLYNDGGIDPVTAAIISQFAENVYFGKPSGLMDQMASSVGGVIAIDFADTKKPEIQGINFDLKGYGHALCIVDTGGNHADLTPEYAAIPVEMKAVAGYLGREYLRGVDQNEFMKVIPELRKRFGDRAVLRSLHFFDDDRIAAEEAYALKRGDFDTFKDLVNRSGLSSETRLQNVFATVNPKEQGLSLALALTKRFLGDKGACRVHGGGFAGTIQAFVPFEMLDAYQQEMEAVFGKGSFYRLSIRAAGGTKVELS